MPDQQRLLFIGGSRGRMSMNAFTLLDTATLSATAVAAKGSVPTGLVGATAAILPHHRLLFAAGYDRLGKPSGELATLDLRTLQSLAITMSLPTPRILVVGTLEWTPLSSDKHSAAPAARVGAAAASFGSRVLLFGGYDAGARQHFNDLLEYDSGKRSRCAC